MRIGVVTPRYPPNTAGGGEISTQLLVKNLVMKTGHDVQVLAFDGPAEEEDPEYVTREKMEESRNDLMNLKAYRSIKEFTGDKDVIHSYNMTFHPAVGRLHGVGTVATLNAYQYLYAYEVPGFQHDPTLATYRRLYSFLARKSMTGIDSLTALSTDVKQIYSKALPGDRIGVVPNMYDPDFQEFHDVETDQNELLFVGSLRKHKGVKELIEQIPDIPKRFHLTIVGDGPELQNLDEAVSCLGLEERVSFEGYVDHCELQSYYEKAGIFIHPGLWPEPFGRTVLEAMQMETPVIATNRGGPKDVLREEQLADTVEGIPEKIRQLDRQEAINYQNQRLEDYAPEKVTEMYEEIYHEVV
jgi:glycosyltransferase involved in cell wall biosynthesis